MKHRSVRETTANAAGRVFGAAIGVLLATGPAAALAQTIEYNVTDIPPVPDAWVTTPLGINNSGEVVGRALFTWSPSNPFFMRAWKWSAQDGLTLLPAPPGSDSNRYGARDISDTGIIVGDAGGDGGLGWRFANGQYTILGLLPGDTVSQAFGVNDAGDVGGTSGLGVSYPLGSAFMFTDEGGMMDLMPGIGSLGRDINNARQVAGRASSPGPSSVEAVRITPGVGIEYLGSPPGMHSSFAFAINEAGDVVGEAFINNNESRAFLFTDDGGMQALPNAINARNQATGINIHRQVVGNGFEGPVKGWVWTAQTGTRNLSDLVDPALNLTILTANGINDRGQIIATGIDLDPLDPSRRLLLTPIVEGDVDGDGDVDFADLAALLASYELCAGELGFNPDADFDGDGCVGFADLATLLANYGAP